MAAARPGVDADAMQQAPWPQAPGRPSASDRVTSGSARTTRDGRREPARGRTPRTIRRRACPDVHNAARRRSRRIHSPTGMASRSGSAQASLRPTAAVSSPDRWPGWAARRATATARTALAAGRSPPGDGRSRCPARPVPGPLRTMSGMARPWGQLDLSANGRAWSPF